MLKNEMKKILKAILGIPVIGRILLIPYRFKLTFPYLLDPVSSFLKWLLTSKEHTNFTYDLEELNKQYLATLIADITNHNFELVMSYIQELETDDALYEHIREATMKSDWRFIADTQVRFGRRIGWYVFARILKPKVIIETGVDKGLGSCLLTAALERNYQEGYEGRYYGTDINPRAGYLLTGEYKKHGCILYGDSIQSLKDFDGIVDLFINDSDHSAQYEAEEYKVISSKLSEGAVVLGDNSHCTNKLFEFSISTNRNFVFFGERPKKHWYRGSGMGL